jgi:hypothetical protein
MSNINFSLPTKADYITVNKIAKFAVSRAKELGVNYTLQDAEMDITAVHLNDCPLKLEEMAENAVEGAQYESDLIHDVFGIRRHINRETGKLEDCFCPRFAQPEKATADEE